MVSAFAAHDLSMQFPVSLCGILVLCNINELYWLSSLRIQQNLVEGCMKWWAWLWLRREVHVQVKTQLQRIYQVKLKLWRPQRLLQRVTLGNNWRPNWKAKLKIVSYWSTVSLFRPLPKSPRFDLGAGGRRKRELPNLTIGGDKMIDQTLLFQTLHEASNLNEV